MNVFCFLTKQKKKIILLLIIRMDKGRLLLKVSGKMDSLSLSYIEGNHDVQLEIDIMFPCFHETDSYGSVSNFVSDKPSVSIRLLIIQHDYYIE